MMLGRVFSLTYVEQMIYEIFFLGLIALDLS
jgi:hypothetical protein